MSIFQNALAARQQGFDEVGKFRATLGQNMAGNALAAGDTQGAANALYSTGQLDAGEIVQQRQESRQDRATQRQYATEDRQASQDKEGREMRAMAMVQAGKALQGIPMEQRLEALNTRVAPMFQRIGIPTDVFQGMTPEDLSDQSLAMFVDQVQRELEIVKGSDGSFSAVDPRTGQIVNQYQAPRYQTVGRDQSLVEIAPTGGGGSAGGGQRISPDMLKGFLEQNLPGVQITSGRRSPEDNARVKGAERSYHLSGNAMDLVPPPGMSMSQLEQSLRASGIPLAELINEGDHIHIAWNGEGLPAGAAQPGVRTIAQGAPDPKRQLEIQNLEGQVQERRQKATDTAQRQASARQAQALKARAVISTVDEALGLVNMGSTGLIGSQARKIPGTPAFDLEAAITTIKANLGFQELQAMREASPTGGALGQVAVQELVALQATVANLDTAQSQAQVRANLQKIRNHYDRWLKAVTASGGQAPAQGGQTRAAPAARPPLDDIFR